jgi:hypothetical protein
MIVVFVVEAGHAHVMKFLPLSCELSIFQVKNAVMKILLIFFNQRLNSKISSCFAPNLTFVCERCALTYLHHFNVFYMERQS